MTIFFTADTHFDHKRICGFTDQSFPSIENMNEELVGGWNSVVKKVKGFVFIKDYHHLRVWEPTIESFQYIVLFHYPIREWRNCHKGAFHLYGHRHKRIENVEWGRSMDVGVDCWNLTPISYLRVKEILTKRSIIMHHDQTYDEE